MENEYDLLKRHLRGTYVKREKFLLYYTPPCKKAASIKSCARRLPSLLGRFKDFAQIGDAGKHGGNRFERHIRVMRQQPRDRRFTAPRRPS